MSGRDWVEISTDHARTGLLTQRNRQPVQIPFTGRLLKPTALAAVRRIHQEGLRLMAEPGLVRADTDAFFTSHFSGEGRILGIFAEHQLIAYAILGLPAGSDYRFDRFIEELGLLVSDWTRIAQLIGVAVLPEWRGNGLHGYLTEWRLELARAAGRWHIAAFSAPGNPCSWRNLLAVGLRIKGIRLLGGDKLRYLLHTDLRSAPSLDLASAVTVAVSAITEQRLLLEQGYWGYAAVMERDVLYMRYARPIPP